MIKSLSHGKSSSKTVAEQEQQRIYQAHCKKITGAKSRITSSWNDREVQRLQPSLRNAKREQQISEKHTQIEKENFRLLQRFMEIDSKAPQNVGTRPKAKMSAARRAELERIERENQGLLKRITTQRSTIDRKRLQQDHEDQQRIMRLRCCERPRAVGPRGAAAGTTTNAAQRASSMGAATNGIVAEDDDIYADDFEEFNEEERDKLLEEEAAGMERVQIDQPIDQLIQRGMLWDPQDEEEASERTVLAAAEEYRSGGGTDEEREGAVGCGFESAWADGDNAVESARTRSSVRTYNSADDKEDSLTKSGNVLSARTQLDDVEKINILNGQQDNIHLEEWGHQDPDVVSESCRDVEMTDSVAPAVSSAEEETKDRYESSATAAEDPKALAEAKRRELDRALAEIDAEFGGTMAARVRIVGRNAANQNRERPTGQRSGGASGVGSTNTKRAAEKKAAPAAIAPADKKTVAAYTSVQRPRALSQTQAKTAGVGAGAAGHPSAAPKGGAALAKGTAKAEEEVAVFVPAGFGRSAQLVKQKKAEAAYGRRAPTKPAEQILAEAAQRQMQAREKDGLPSFTAHRGAAPDALGPNKQAGSSVSSSSASRGPVLGTGGARASSKTAVGDGDYEWDMSRTEDCSLESRVNEEVRRDALSRKYDLNQIVSGAGRGASKQFRAVAVGDLEEFRKRQQLQPPALSSEDSDAGASSSAEQQQTTSSCSEVLVATGGGLQSRAKGASADPLEQNEVGASHIDAGSSAILEVTKACRRWEPPQGVEKTEEELQEARICADYYLHQGHAEAKALLEEQRKAAIAAHSQLQELAGEKGNVPTASADEPLLPSADEGRAKLQRILRDLRIEPPLSRIARATDLDVPINSKPTEPDFSSGASGVLSVAELQPSTASSLLSDRVVDVPPASSELHAFDRGSSANNHEQAEYEIESGAPTSIRLQPSSAAAVFNDTSGEYIAGDHDHAAQIYANDDTVSSIFGSLGAGDPPTLGSFDGDPQTSVPSQALSVDDGTVRTSQLREEGHLADSSALDVAAEVERRIAQAEEIFRGV